MEYGQSCLAQKHASKSIKMKNCKTLKYTMFSYRPTRLSLCSCIWDGWSTLSKLLCGCQLVMDRRTLRATAGAWDCFNPSKKWSMKQNIQWFFTSIQVPYAIQGTCLCLQVEQSTKISTVFFFFPYFSPSVCFMDNHTHSANCTVLYD